MSAAARSKIIKPVGVSPDELELSVAQNMADLEANVADLKSDLKGLQFVQAKEILVGSSKRAIVIFVPVPSLKQFHKVQTKLVRELEKKFSDRHVIIVAQRRIMSKPTRNSRAKQQRPRSRTLTAVHESLLEDMVFPTEIVGKRTRVRTDGSKLLKVYVVYIANLC
jgi:small subunit ribosomal protein S7e